MKELINNNDPVFIAAQASISSTLTYEQAYIL